MVEYTYIYEYRAHKLLEHRENKLFESISKNRNMKIKTE